MNGLLIFDFDGVIGDSEIIANSVLAAMATEIGVATSLGRSLDRYMGMRSSDLLAALERDRGGALPPGFAADLQRRTLAALGRDLDPVEGAVAFIEAFATVPRCIASSSSPDRLALCLDRLGLTEAFGGRVFSTASVERGKPHPDIFLHAARRMGIAPPRAIVIEDSPSGVRGAVAAGMTAIGLLAGAHIRPGHRERLLEAGARHVVESFAEATPLVCALLAGSGARV